MSVPEGQDPKPILLYLLSWNFQSHIIPDLKDRVPGHLMAIEALAMSTPKSPRGGTRPANSHVGMRGLNLH